MALFVGFQNLRRWSLAGRSHCLLSGTFRVHPTSCSLFYFLCATDMRSLSVLLLLPTSMLPWSSWFSIFTGLLSVWTGRSLIILPSLGTPFLLIFLLIGQGLPCPTSMWWLLFYLIFHFVMFGCCLLAWSFLMMRERKKADPEGRRGGGTERSWDRVREKIIFSPKTGFLCGTAL